MHLGGRCSWYNKQSILIDVLYLYSTLSKPKRYQIASLSIQSFMHTFTWWQDTELQPQPWTRHCVLTKEHSDWEPATHQLNSYHLLYVMLPWQHFLAKTFNLISLHSLKVESNNCLSLEVAQHSKQKIIESQWTRSSQAPKKTFNKKKTLKSQGDFNWVQEI